MRKSKRSEDEDSNQGLGEARVEEQIEEGKSGEQSGEKDIKLGEIQLRDDSVLLVKKTSWKGFDRIDFRIWKNTPTYKGPTKQGFVVPMEKVDEFLGIMDEVKKKLKPRKEE